MELEPGLFSNNSSDDINQDSVPIEFVVLILKSYVLGTAKCCQLVWDEMSMGHVYEVGINYCLLLLLLKKLCCL